MPKIAVRQIVLALFAGLAIILFNPLLSNASYETPTSLLPHRPLNQYSSNWEKLPQQA